MEQFIYSQKNNFSSGELTPTIEGRTELALYQNGVKKLINFMLLPTGGIMRRHGTKFVHLFEGNIPKKMVSVMFSRKLSYLLVFESHKLKTTCSFFVGGELFLTSKVLKDNGLPNGNDFHFRPKDFSYCVFQGIAYISFGSNRPIFKFCVDPEIVDKFYDHLKKQARIRQEENNERPEIASTRALEFAANFPDKDKMFIIEPLKCHVNYFKISQHNTKQRPFNEVIYNAEVDKINDELKSIHQQANNNIFEKQQEQLYATSLVTFENRLWCFGVNKNIHSIWASYKGDFSDFRMAYKTLLEARNPLTAFSATFSSATFDNVLWSIPFSNELLLGTTDGIYLVKEGDRSKGEFVKIHKEIEVPVSQVKPVTIGKTIFFVEGSGCKINSLYYSQEKGGFQISDITVMAEHIFSCGIRQIVGVNSPFSIIFAVFKNGSFATFIYSQDLKIMGWSQHFLGGNAEVLGITPVYADNEDRLYFHVRRADDLGTNSKEYLEVLETRYFSSKPFDSQRAVYADCHVNIEQEGENATYHSIMQAIKDDSACEFRGGITKLEHIVQAAAENILKLDIDNIDIANSFKYKNKLASEYGEHNDDIKEFLKKYYKDYLPVIMETLGISFAYHRIFGTIIAELENVFSGHPESLSKVEQLLCEGEKLGGDLIKTITGEGFRANVLGELHLSELNEEPINQNLGIQNWDIPPILRDNGLMEYLPNNAWSFHPVICSKIKTLNVELIKVTAGLVKDIITDIKTVINSQLEESQELNELRKSVAIINKRLLLVHANKDNDNNKELLVNIKRFFAIRSIDFYTELSNIAHPTLTKYLFSRQVKELINNEINAFNQATAKEQLNNKIKDVANHLITKLEQIYQEEQKSEITSFKRREELTISIKDLFLTKDLSKPIEEYILSNEFKQVIDKAIDDYEFPLTEDDKIDEAQIPQHIIEGGMEEPQSFVTEEESPAYKVNQQMQDLKESLVYFQTNLIELVQLVMPTHNPLLLKSILEDEKSVKLEKYLLLSKKYFPVFKKLFPNIDSYELSVIARNCLPSFQQVKLEGILPIFKDKIVSIIGDGELHSSLILSDELIKLKHPVRNLSIGFSYSSLLQTFPFIFADEVELLPKANVELGVKLYNTKGGYIEELLDNGTIEKQHINSKYVDSDSLVRLVNEKKYLAVKEVCDVLATPYKSGWVYFISSSNIKTDIDFIFIVDKPYPASILKVYAKAKILPSYKGDT